MSIKIIFEYIWFDQSLKFRSKTRVVNMHRPLISIVDIPFWNYDGSSTGQAKGLNTEILLKPVMYVPDPFRRNHHSFLVLCDLWNDPNTPHPDNHRPHALSIFQKYFDTKPWYGYEQEYFILHKQTLKPINMDDQTTQATQQFYCGIGSQNIFERELVEKHFEYCLYMGLDISGMNAEVAISQWEFQIGPVEGIESCDQLLLARYVLERLTESTDYLISYEPKLWNEWNGSGCHTNFSTQAMRDEGGYDVILQSMEKLQIKHKEHIAQYGENNHLRLTGLHETSSMETFTWGIGTRHTSIRISNDVKEKGCGYFEDRRPASNMNPYLVAPLILETICI